MGYFGTDEGAQQWLVLQDWPGLVMTTVAWGLTAYCDFAVCYLSVRFGWSNAVIGTYQVLVALSLTAHARTMTTDPGAVSADAAALRSGSDSDMETICGRCDAYKPPHSHHCRVCNRCIVRMDHHCPWMNNCIGALNQKFFILFLVYTWLECAMGLGLVAARVGVCDGNGVSGGACFPGQAGGIAVALVVLAGIAFIFVSSMLYNQVYAVRTGIGTIDRMRGRPRMASTGHAAFRPLKWTEVFGDGGSILLWPVPTSPDFKRVDRILGFSSHSGHRRRSGDGGGGYAAGRTEEEEEDGDEAATPVV